MIVLKQLTKTFANGRGIFNLDFQINKGEVFGYLGPNGAGKSTTIRHLMGFLKPNKGSSTINGLNCWTRAAEIQKDVGYLPGEIAFPEGMTGAAFLRFMLAMRKDTDSARRDALVDRFQLDLGTPIRKMSKGMKQKLAIIAAFMHEPSVLILDEPTSGLDPLMQKVFIELISEEKRKGKTILMSSHSFDEIDKTCDRIGIIKDGRIVATDDVKRLHQRQRKIFEVTFANETDARAAAASGLDVVEHKGHTVDIAVQGDYHPFFKVINHGEVININARAQELEEIFMEYYVEEGDNK